MKQIFLLFFALASLVVAVKHPFARQKGDFQNLKELAHKHGRVPILLSLRTGPNLATFKADLRQLHQTLNNGTKKIFKDLHPLPIVKMDVDGSTLLRLSRSKNVLHISLDAVMEKTDAATFPELRFYSDVQHEGRYQTWNRGAGAYGADYGDAYIAIIDNGVHWHDTLNDGRNHKEACFSTGGYETTWNGFEWYTASSCDNGGPVDTASPYLNAAALDNEDHGTPCASIAASRTSFNGVQFEGSLVGMAPKMNIYSITVAHQWWKYPIGGSPSQAVMTSNGNSDSSDSQAALAHLLSEVQNNGLNLMAVSYSSAGSSTCSANDAWNVAIAALKAEGVAFFSSAGNSGSTNSIGSPASCPDGHGVGLVFAGAPFNLNSISSTSDLVDFYGVGHYVDTAHWSTNSGTYTGFGGTSAACPFIASSFAILRSQATRSEFSNKATVVDQIVSIMSDPDYALLIDDTRPGGTVQDVPFPRVSRASPRVRCGAYRYMKLVMKMPINYPSTRMLREVEFFKPDGSQIPASSISVVSAGTSPCLQNGWFVDGNVNSGISCPSGYNDITLILDFGANPPVIDKVDALTHVGTHWGRTYYLLEVFMDNNVAFNNAHHMTFFGPFHWGRVLYGVPTTRLAFCHSSVNTTIVRLGLHGGPVWGGTPLYHVFKRIKFFDMDGAEITGVSISAASPGNGASGYEASNTLTDAGCYKKNVAYPYDFIEYEFSSTRAVRNVVFSDKDDNCGTGDEAMFGSLYFRDETDTSLWHQYPMYTFQPAASSSPIAQVA